MTIKWTSIVPLAILAGSIGLGCAVQSSGNKPAPKAKTGAVCPKPLPKKAVKPKSAVKKKPISTASAAKPVVAKKTPRLLDLGATGCVPCKMMVPVLDGLAKDYKGTLTVEFIDVWKIPSAAEKHKIQSIPTQIFYDTNGKEFYRHVGFFPKEDILKVFKDKGIKISK
ncbi:MAG: thioredoxin family protein [Armatimonadota bacterium]